MLLRDDEGNAAVCETTQSLAPTRLRRGVHDVVTLRRVEVVALDPGAVRRPGRVRVGGDDPAHGRRHAMAREQLDHAVAIGVADGRRGVDDDRACFLHRSEAIENRSALAHDEEIGRGGFNDSVGGDQFNAEASLPHGVGDAFHDRGVVIDAAGRVCGLAQDASAGGPAVHASMFSGERRNPACSAASTSCARSMSNTSGRTTP